MNLTNNPKENIKLILKEARKIYPDFPIVAELAATQAILESRLNGIPSKLALEGNNLFGIKDTAKTDEIELNTTECTKNKCERVKAKFAKFSTIEASFIYHRHLMQTGTKSNPNRYLGVFKAKTFEEAAKAVKDGGYATDPNYTKKLINTWITYIKGK